MSFKPHLVSFKVSWQLVITVVCGVVLVNGVTMLGLALFAKLSDGRASLAFLIPGALITLFAIMGLRIAGRLTVLQIRPRDTFLAVTLAWVSASAIGAIPFLTAGTFDGFYQGFFEAMSGFTTAGATLIDTMEKQPQAILLWRSLTHWLGGMGIVVLYIAVAPALGKNGQQVFDAESSGLTVERLTPRIADTAKILWKIYLALTVVGILGFLGAGMGVFDAVNHSMSSVATGGFSTKTLSLAAFDSLAVELVAIIIMLASAINFILYYKLIKGNPLRPQLSELKAFLGIYLLIVLALTISLLNKQAFFEALRDTAFTVASLISTTGFTTADFDTWNDFARFSLVLLMFIGGCIGSTAGGMKVIRIVLLFKSAKQEVESQLKPKLVPVLRLGGEIIPERVRHGLYAFLVLYLAVYLSATLLLTIFGLDMISSISAVAASLNVVGPGLNQVGALENYGAIPESGIWVLSFCMLVGRLEVFTVLALFLPAFWRKR